MTGLPFDAAAERQLLGAMMINPDVIPSVLDLLTVEDIYVPRHKSIMEAVLALHQRGEPTEPLAVVYELAAGGTAGMAEHVHECVSSVPVVANAPFYAGVVADHARRRRIIEIGLKGSDAASQTHVDPEKIGTWMGDELRTAMGERLSDYVTVASGVEAYTAFSRAGGGTTYPTGISALDGLLDGGFRAPQLVTVAGRPGMGKSIFGTELIRQLALRPTNPIPVVLVSLEMGHLEVMQRLISAHTQIPLALLRRGLPADDIRWPLIAELSASHEKAPLWVADRVFSLERVVALAKRARHHHGPDGVFVLDYTQLVTPSKRRDSRASEVSEITRSLKMLAGDIGWPVVAMSQLNRNPEGRADRRPMLADLRESGSIEQDSDIVVMLHRPSYYDPNDRPGEIDFMVVKNRHGATGTVTGTAHFHISRFANLVRVAPGPRKDRSSAWD